jgi:hypothetical protein
LDKEMVDIVDVLYNHTYDAFLGSYVYRQVLIANEQLIVTIVLV